MNTAIEFFGSVIIVLLIFDIISRLNSTYWFRKGFDMGISTFIASVKNVTTTTKK